MNAATPPIACACAITVSVSVVLPDDSGPKISMMRPRGKPPTPSAWSIAIDPVGIVSTDSFECSSPSRMIDPSPYSFAIACSASSRFLSRVRGRLVFPLWFRFGAFASVFAAIEVQLKGYYTNEQQICCRFS